MKTIFIHIESGEITNSQVIREAFQGLKDGRYKVEIKSHKTRSLGQNDYIHGVMIPMVYQGLRDAGFDEVRSEEHAKMVIKGLFLKRTIKNERTGEAIEIVMDTHTLNTLEFSEFIESVIKWAQEYLNVTIPFPNEQLLIKFL